MEKAGLKAAPSKLVRPPRVAASPCALECKVTQIVRLEYLPGEAPETYVVFGQVIGVHMDDRFIKDGLLDTAAMKPIARCGYQDYSLLDATFRMVRPR
jgi:flavin reductase (DIM6/NTAB) family NADH-FMN oxidoreductase RutF